MTLQLMVKYINQKNYTTMKLLKRKSEITATNLKAEDCDYKGHRIGYDNKEKLYVMGSHFNPMVTYFETVRELKEVFG